MNSCLINGSYSILMNTKSDTTINQSLCNYKLTI